MTRLIEEAAELIAQAERPVLYVGGGVLKARAAEPLLKLAELLQIPVVTTLMARGAFPDRHELCLGMPGMHGNYTAVTAMQKSDLLISLGARFDDRVTGKLDGFAPTAKIIHVDIDPAELGKVRQYNVGIQGDCRLVIEGLIEATEALGASAAGRPFRLALHRLGLAGEVPARLRTVCSGRQAQAAVRDGAAARRQPAATRSCARVSVSTRCTPASSGSSTTPTPGSTPAVWARWASRSRRRSARRPVCRTGVCVWAVDGDGNFQMTAQELVTATVEDIPIKVALFNNSYLGMVRQWQEMFYDERASPRCT